MSALIALSIGFSADATVEFGAWKLAHGKSYGTTAEEAHRQSIWLASRDRVAAHNARDSSWTAGLNAFSDLTWDEFSASRLMTPQNCSATHTPSWHGAVNTALPNSVDWRKKHALNGIKNQGHCGSCWTFSTTGTLEAHHFLKTGQMRNLSEQQLVDCAGAFNNFGCNGGLPSQAFEYIRYAGGLDTEATYPYTAVTGPKCKKGSYLPGATVAFVYNITAFDEDELLRAVALEGPVSIAFQVAHDFQDYKDGVYDGTCEQSPSSVNHAVVAVGYGETTKKGNAPYWIVRNSWGTDWGMDGYFQIARGKNKCGLADCASFPLV